ncbi:MAG: hypothetical protein ABW208_06045 [Pyrinomonadaceae bacterium]
MSAEVPISELVELDARPAPNALADAVGDRYLYSTNPVFANVRDAAVHFGYRFSARNTRLWRDYQVLPLLTLHRIIRGKVVPYSDNRSTLTRLLERHPGVALPASFIQNNIKRNYTLHEAAHCIASSIFRREDPGFAFVCRTKKERFVLKEILSESFANTVETFAAAVDPSPMPAFIFSLNSYMRGTAKGKEVMDGARREFGDDLAFLILWLCYFEANLALGEPDESTHVRVLEAADAPLSPDFDTQLFARLISIGFELNRGFRESTALTYFGLLGCGPEFGALREARWLEHDRYRNFARHVGSVFAEVMWRGVRSRVAEGNPRTLMRAHSRAMQSNK